MPLRATDNPLVLPLLGLLLEQPRHQYGLLAGLRERYQHLRVRTGSVYTLVGSLRAEGWIEPADQTTDRPTFQLTEAGIAHFRARVQADLEDADPANAARFVTALAYVGILERSIAVSALTNRVQALRQRAAELEEGLDNAGLPAIYMSETAFFASQTRHDIAWLERFTQEIADPGYAWPAENL
ncbi:PadR family transcriptional regulator [Kineosporia rhizophila]|uniref:PadR family transcriptional regulator n=1 Tax=Kineosporia TaxID=49184 RepID=UPI001E392E44|nr:MULTISPECIES: helix-turn-helix transcriptional regulator [Kineosporia]MCE0536420.1 PadR family transcriptional regulator [Kineosporia rhizophila]GLY15488.1 hypothetical protein Kisp01_25030 [Kineosporia sp. NBRC 101677]